ncbi:MAG: hypothetical protein K2Z81_11160 [Cyanobacteria bacterium]|nr:hypothetical protein [Cyanobacteriota bacterium]
MFAYVLIAAELFILCSAFWYVFVREPRPFEINENLWGIYDESVDAYSDHVKLKRSRGKGLLEHSRLRSQRHGNQSGSSNNTDMKNGWIFIEEKPNSVIGVLLASIGSKLTKLSVKFD